MTGFTIDTVHGHRVYWMKGAVAVICRAKMPPFNLFDCRGLGAFIEVFGTETSFKFRTPAPVINVWLGLTEAKGLPCPVVVSDRLQVSGT